MANETTELRHFDSLYTVAEDITRFAPWESGIAPFVLTDPEHPEAYVLVAIEDDGEGTSDIRLMLGLSGIRSWMVEQSASEEADEDNADEFSVERFVGHYDGYYLEVGYNMPNLNSYEKRQLEGRDQRITFRRQRPGYGMSTIVDNRDYAHLERYLRAILKLLTRQMLGDLTNGVYRLQMHGAREMLRTAAFSLEEDGPQPIEPFVLTRDDWLAKQGSHIDEFTNARVKHLPCDGHLYELYFFYLPMMVAGKGELPRAFFLVDLESGFLEWNDVIMDSNDWQEKLLRQLWNYFLDQGARPQELLIQNVNAFCALATDIGACGIRVEYIPQTYVGQELLDSYLQATHLKQHQIIDNSFPRDPY